MSSIQRLKARVTPTGGFSPTGSSREDRPDATAWAILLLAAVHPGSELLEPARTRLVHYQLNDGRVVISLNYPEVFWPTALAILAWHPSPAHQVYQTKAVEFLLNTTGKHWIRTSDSPVAHDTALRGWPWIEHTHSWVEATALAMLALYTVGRGEHARVKEAIALLLDRQLPHGGWNYGNTLVFGHELWPSPEDTGAALTALAGQVAEAAVQRSLEYLATRVTRIRTPIALGWSLLGLKAWGKLPKDAHAWIEETLRRESRYGEYDTASLCLLLASQVELQGLSPRH
ncbi:MAG: hypothetical protein D6704_00945 [Nitrospirae bacterium]|nr:MAG: hypothetical protein D6704_00945 [Nitrospirota bacterium]